MSHIIIVGRYLKWEMSCDTESRRAVRPVHSTADSYGCCRRSEFLREFGGVYKEEPGYARCFTLPTLSPAERR